MSKQTRQFLESITDPAALKKQGYVPLGKWGKDHWSTFAYAGHCVTERLGLMQGDKLRTKDRVGIEKRYALGPSWDPKYGTRLRGFFENKSDKTLQLPDHDDIDCLEDAEAEGLLVLGTTISMYVQLTKKGQEVEAALRVFKQDGGNFEDFGGSTAFRALLLKYEADGG